jgi:hypothetical protein
MEWDRILDASVSLEYGATIRYGWSQKQQSTMNGWKRQQLSTKEKSESAMVRRRRQWQRPMVTILELNLIHSFRFSKAVKLIL